MPNLKGITSKQHKESNKIRLFAHSTLNSKFIFSSGRWTTEKNRKLEKNLPVFLQNFAQQMLLPSLFIVQFTC